MDDCLSALLCLEFAPTEQAAIKGWKYGAGAILGEVGRDRFKAGVQKVLQEVTKFPTPAQLRGFIPERKATVFCGKCTEGFLYGQNQHGDAVVYDCPCHPRRRA